MSRGSQVLQRWFFSLVKATVCALLLGPVSAVAADPPAALAAPTSGSLVGRVLDQRNLPLAGARLTATPEGRSAAAAVAVSRTDGRFEVRLSPGSYVVRAECQGFAAEEATLGVSVGATATRDFTLQLAIADSITVHAESGYRVQAIGSGMRTMTPLLDTPQSITVVTHQLMQDQLMTSLGDVVRYVPGMALHQGENNRDQVVIRGNSSSADFFLDGIRDDVQYYRDLYNLDRVEALKGPNAMVFGRGGGGGVINRVTKEAGFDAVDEVGAQGGSYSNRRVSADFDRPLGEKLALRLNGVYETSGSFRDRVDLRRSGVAPTLTYVPDAATKITVGYEHFRDQRVADRGITSYQGRPADVPIDTFYGNPEDSHVRAQVDLTSVGLEHSFGALAVRNRTLYGDYDRFYQNYVPGAVSPDKSKVTLTAYNNRTARRNLFNQTDVTYSAHTGSVKHTLLAGAEFGRQLTDNFRNTGFFGNATSVQLPYAHPTIDTVATFRQSATDADNHLRSKVTALYAQDQIELSPRLQVVAGVRFDRFALDYANNRNGDRLGRVDDRVSPRLGIVVKPVANVSLYSSYTVSHLPSSGDQFSSLTAVTQQVEPEGFDNYEIGGKWDAADALSLTTAIYRLDRTHTRSTDANDPTRIVQTGSQRTDGFELGVNGRILPVWSIAGGYAYQDAFVTRATVAARAGARVAQVPHHTVSLWNNVQIARRVGAALGVIYRSAMFAAVDDAVTLPGYTRFDAAAYVSLTPAVRLQLNVENLLDRAYWANADSNTNLSPGSPRAVRFGVTAKF
ncbi:MAG: TonB-dependent siderophore receptor [Acidobacteriota bacterium]